MSSETTHPQPGDSVPQALGRLRVALDDAFQRSSRELGLSAPQAELLCAALRPTPVGDLALALRCDRSNVTRLVGRAAERGLIRRGGDVHDGRVTLVELSPKGRQLAERFIASLEAQVQGALSGWSADREHATIKALDEISATLDATASQRSRTPSRRKANAGANRSGVSRKELY